jgi:pilus assembly protein CpaC
MNLIKKLFTIGLLTVALFVPIIESFAAGKGESKHSAKTAINVHSFHHVLQSMLPKERIEVSVVKGSVVLSGIISSIEAADKAERMAKEYFGHNVTILNFMKVKGSHQVMLKVRVGEVKRDVLRNYNSTTANFDYLEQQGLLKTLAEPNLVAMSGERAEFLAGGEFPVPTAQKEGNISIDYKSYGVKVVFTPLVLSQKLSEISKESSVNVGGFNIPSITSRRAKTTIELAPGESFMIAGLVKEDYKGNRGKETELVISVTPYLVDPMHSKDLRLPTDNIHAPTALEKSFISKVSQGTTISTKSNQAKLTGPVGFIAE